jgi:ABC-type phosphate transport system substrate-binding protein
MRMTNRYLNLFCLLLLASGMLCSLGVTSARADIAVIVNVANPLKTLDSGELQRIFMGRTRMFPDSTQGIETIDQPEDAAVFVDFYQKVMRITPAKLKRQRASYLFSGKGRLPVVKDDDASVKAFVAQTPAAIGYVQAEQVDDTVKVVATVKTE